MAPIIAAGIAAASGLASNAINLFSQSNANYKSYKYTERLMQYQNFLNQQNWHMQNAYNSPAAQMARYQAAGLNPNVIYGNSQQVSSGNAGEIASVQPSQFRLNAPAMDLSFVSTAINAALAQSQIKKNAAETQGQEIQNKYDSESFGMRLETLQQNIANMQANKSLTENKIKESGLSQEYQAIVLKYLDAYQKFGLRAQYFSINKLEQEVKDLEYKINQLNPLKKKELDATIQNLRAYTENLQQNTFLAGSLTLNAEEQREVIAQNAENLAKTYQKIEAEIENIQAATGLTEKDVRNYVWTHLTGIGAAAVGAGVMGATKAKRLPVNQRYNLQMDLPSNYDF